jgi:hypothetical protein
MMPASAAELQMINGSSGFDSAEKVDKDVEKTGPVEPKTNPASSRLARE